MDTPIQPRTSDSFDTWAVVELFGHVKLAGKVTEVEMFGAKMLRLDVPAVDGHLGFTKFYGGSAVFSLAPTTEEIAVGVIRRLRPAPVTPYDVGLRPQLTAAPQEAQVVEDDDDGDPTW
jgi:hypothetical protein